MKNKRKQCIICGKKLSLYSTLYRPNAKYCIKHRNEYISKTFTKGIPKSKKIINKLRKLALLRKPTRIGAVLSQKTKEKISRSLKKYFKNNPGKIRRGKLCPFYGKSANHGKHIKYKNIWLKSGWEEAFAKWCDKNKIKWSYESKTFDLGNTTYTPDFYLPEFNLWIEVKGWWRDDAKTKFELFQKKYSKIKIILLNKKSLRKLEIL